MRLRPLPGLTLACIPVLILLLALGVWQVQRAGWKADLVAEWEAREAAPPVPLSEAVCEPERGGPVTLDGAEASAELRMYGAGPDGTPGWLILVPVRGSCAEGERVALAETAFEPLSGERRAAGGPLLLERWPEIGAFTPENDTEAGLYYRFDAAELAAALDAPEAALVPWWARWETRSPLERTSIAPATHIGYAATWFGLAAALVGVWLALHARLGRLRFGQRS